MYGYIFKSVVSCITLFFTVSATFAVANTSTTKNRMKDYQAKSGCMTCHQTHQSNQDQE